MSGSTQPDAKPRVEIYTWLSCQWCWFAKVLLWMRGVSYTEYKIDGDEQARSEMAKRAQGRRTVPQIFINDRHVGGGVELNSLQFRGGLKALLSQAWA